MPGVAEIVYSGYSSIQITYTNISNVNNNNFITFINLTHIDLSHNKNQSYRYKFI